MKRIVFVLLMMMSVASIAYAQKVSGSFAPLKDGVRSKLIIDISNADIMGMNEDEFASFEEDWEHDKIEVFSLVYNYANKELKGLFSVGNYKADTDYILRLIVHAIDVRGDYDCDLILFHGGAEIARAEGFYTPGGTFGSKLNLMKDGAEHTGTAIGRFLKAQIMPKEPKRKKNPKFNDGIYK